MKSLIPLMLAALALSAHARDYHVAVDGNDANNGAAAKPYRTIAAAAMVAQPGDVITVHAGIYRERVNPPRGGTSDAQRIIYQAAPGEKVTITGSEPAKGWERVAGDTWKLVIPSKHFGNFNPYVDRIRGDWFNPNGRVHHSGCVYLNGEWLIEARSMDEVNAPAGKTPLWFATVDGDDGAPLLNIASVKTATSASVSGGEPSYRYGGKPAACSEGGTCSAFIQNGHWLRFDGVDFGNQSTTVKLRAAAASVSGALVELRLNNPEGKFLGVCKVEPTGDWQKWRDFTATIEPLSGKQSLCLVFKTAKLDEGNTTIHAQFPGVNPNEAQVEINQRQTVFYPSANYINYITVRGFTLENAATNWAPPSSEQLGLIGSNWSKGWVIENNTVRQSKCAGISLGKYGDGTDNTNDAGAADPYTACVRRALTHGWNRETVGSHIVRNNHIHHCEQVGIVGSMGAAFSTIEGNDIHDIQVHKLFSGAEMAGIKLHAAVDVTIRNNHIYRCSRTAGIWLDWMTQGTRVTANLMHDNAQQDIFLEVNHGPYLIDNNIFLSRHNISNMSHGGAYVHNLFAGGISSGQVGEPGRKTPYLQPHGTAITDTHRVIPGDDRFANNLFVGGNGLGGYNWAKELPLVAGNYFLKGAAPWTGTPKPAISAHDPALRLTSTADGVTLSWSPPPMPPDLNCALIDTAALGSVSLVNQPFTHPDGSPLKVDHDYFGKSRNPKNGSPGPFELLGSSPRELKVWPK